jgi:hypothetical protein
MTGIGAASQPDRAHSFLGQDLLKPVRIELANRIFVKRNANRS